MVDYCIGTFGPISASGIRILLITLTTAPAVLGSTVLSSDTSEFVGGPGAGTLGVRTSTADTLI